MRVELRVEGRVIVIEAAGAVSVRISEEGSPAAAAACAPAEVPEATEAGAQGGAPDVAVIPQPVAPAEVAVLSDDDLFADLAQLRRDLAASAGVPPYVVFTDRSLHEMVARRPADLAAFEGISGVGKARLERYGEAFVAAIKGASV